MNRSVVRTLSGSAWIVALVIFSGVVGLDSAPEQKKASPHQLRRTDPGHQSLKRKPTTRRKGGKRGSKRTRRRPAGVAYFIPVQLTLGDGRVLRGRLRFRAPRELALNHTRKGVQFTKIVKMPDIRSIKVTRWKAHYLRKAKREQGDMYRFEPSEYEIVLKNETRLSRKGRLLPFLYHLRMETAEGRTTLFSYWIDLRRPNGSWFTGMQGKQRTVCHRDAVRTIRFHRPGEKFK